MSLILRIGRWTLTLLAVEIDEPELYDEGPAMSMTSQSEIAPGFVPPQEYWEVEDESHRQGAGDVERGRLDPQAF